MSCSFRIHVHAMLLGFGSLLFSCGVLAPADCQVRLSWDKRFRSPFGGDDYPISIVVSLQGQVTAVGSGVGTHGYTEYSTVSYSASGKQLWQR